MKYPFTQEQFETAARAWGCNCGPSALAFACQISLDLAGYAIPDFTKKGYTSPQMMKAALAELKKPWSACALPPFKPGTPIDIEPMFQDAPSLVRIQWTGPWTKPGMNPRWAYGQTHWITTWKERGLCLAFDCNAGIVAGTKWADEVAPFIISHIKRADGEWFPTHIWTLGKGSVAA